MNLYLPPAATTNLLRIGTVESAAFLGAVISVSATGAISNFSHSVISIYASKAVNKNGIIVKDKVDGSVSRIVVQ